MTDTQKRETCPQWCEGHHTDDPDPACWSGDDSHQVPLSMDETYPSNADPASPQFWTLDPPKIGMHAYRRSLGCRPTVHLWCYRPHDNEHLDIDVTFDLTADEARALADHLRDVANEIDQTGPHGMTRV